jgi:hypothetical protein
MPSEASRTRCNTRTRRMALEHGQWQIYALNSTVPRALVRAARCTRVQHSQVAQRLTLSSNTSREPGAGITLPYVPPCAAIEGGKLVGGPPGPGGAMPGPPAPGTPLCMTPTVLPSWSSADGYMPSYTLALVQSITPHGPHCETTCTTRAELATEQLASMTTAQRC